MGTTVSDYHHSEKQRQISTQTSLLHTEWLGKKFNIMDTPGYLDFVGEALSALRVADFALVVVHAQHGIGVGTERMWNYANEFGIPKFIVINAVDKQNEHFDQVLEDARAHYGNGVFPLAVPINPGPGFNQVLDVMRSEVVTYNSATGKYTEEPATGEWKDKSHEAPHGTGRAHRRVGRHAALEVLRSRRIVGGGIPRRHSHRDSEADVHSALVHVGGDGHRHRAADGLHREVRLVARGPREGAGPRRARRRSGRGAHRSRRRAFMCSRR